MTNCLFFGDSITYGEYDGVHGGWVDLLKRYCHAKFKEGANEVNLFNLGIGGETTFGLLKRLEVELAARKSSTDNLIFISYGANDLAYAKGFQYVTTSVFRKNIEKAISKAQLVSDNIYLISILPIANAYDGVESASGKTRRNEDVITFNNIIKDICYKNNVSYIDTYSAFLNNKEAFISNDGIHPNEKGYAFISELVKPILEVYL